MQSAYFLESLLLWLFRQRMNCPNCGKKSREIVDRKWIVTTLRRCPGCELLYRAPTTPPQTQQNFYQKRYSQGFTTDMPGKIELQKLIQEKFRKTERDYTSYVKILKALGLKKGSRLLEYGCSWGYGAWQLQEEGFKVTAFEISKPRCQFARKKLGIDAHDKVSGIQKKFDVVFSAHVLEHVDQVETALSRQLDCLKPNGWLVGITPNGSSAFRMAHPKNFHHLWGLVHPQLLDEKFLRKRFLGLELWLGSIAGLNGVRQIRRAGNPKVQLDRWELIFAVRKSEKKSNLVRIRKRQPWF